MHPVHPDKISLFQKIQHLLERNPNVNDVTFSVGPHKQKIRASKLILMSASHVFEKEFTNRFAVENRYLGIPLPDFDADAFQIFVTLIVQDTWTSDALKVLNLHPDQILNLVAICRHYEMNYALGPLEELVATFHRSFLTFSATPEFLALSPANFRAIISSDNIAAEEVQIFHAACRWAATQCEKLKLKPTPQNVRLALGDSIFEIRFPLMSVKEFIQATAATNILTTEEGFQICKFLNSQGDSSTIDVTKLPLKSSPRSPPFKALSLTKNIGTFTNLQISCDGQERFLNFTLNQKIILHGLGFLGPVEADDFYYVTIRVYDSLPNSWVLKRASKHILAKKGKKFYFIFDKPITLHARQLEWRRRISIYHSIKGPRVPAIAHAGSNSIIKEEDLEFHIRWGNSLISEILFEVESYLA